MTRRLWQLAAAGGAQLLHTMMTMRVIARWVWDSVRHSVRLLKMVVQACICTLMVEAFTTCWWCRFDMQIHRLSLTEAVLAHVHPLFQPSTHAGH